ncbi:MAG: hypothetical protein A3I24_04295 [Candidatus Harrisonbacteria bacterium RIFCSPLOWO2_02_FULL_41_13b]|uniref:Enoyl-CoA hydratase n=1 Tax=Candidatus Harrisonbacteria bacterium RIFCSPLOWO2_02_FULL_41_13b TaxID=1798409 RepID=A0A1G1ZQZ3_9BACT|nr:MAG: hypothetical protein A3J53_01695 [Candidatus Harrisonbacteria bacterium RIFCSPHIGHO2_02_FULL_40_20]OGY66879.1 MAG: hypothetical protein A3I24_04295 [Candidatus Harrisonbacteria bacterium RIFCSPLOWO2_02_FULL_41_13b]
MLATAVRKVETEVNDYWGVLKLNGNGYLDSVLLADLEIGLMKLLDDKKVMAIVIVSSRPETFGYGLDRKELAQLVEAGRGKTEEFLRRWGQLCLLLQNSSKPTFAAISGVCADAALELALACQYRIASRTALMGFTGITRGLIPCMGGTQRLPRLIGVKKAMLMMVGADKKLVHSRDALADGLVDAVVENSLAEAASQFAARVLAGRSGISRTMPQDRELDRADFADGKIFDFSADKPLAAMNGLIVAVRNGMDQKQLTTALEIELKECLDCLFLK